MDVGAFVYRYFDEMSGVSFLPHFDHIYPQAPYQDCTEEEYNDMLKNSPENIDWSRLMDYEKEDTTSGSQTFACSGDTCEIVDIGA
jgi:ribonucleoside-diphosphate reductase alpha chain